MQKKGCRNPTDALPVPYSSASVAKQTRIFICLNILITISFTFPICPSSSHGSHKFWHTRCRLCWLEPCADTVLAAPCLIWAFDSKVSRRLPKAKLCGNQKTTMPDCLLITHKGKDTISSMQVTLGLSSVQFSEIQCEQGEVLCRSRRMFAKLFE